VSFFLGGEEGLGGAVGVVAGVGGGVCTSRTYRSTCTAVLFVLFFSGCDVGGGGDLGLERCTLDRGTSTSNVLNGLFEGDARSMSSSIESLSFVWGIGLGSLGSLGLRR